MSDLKPIDCHDTYMTTYTFNSLNGLRAIAILSVILHHTIGHSEGLPWFFSVGFHGSTLFFSISGFLITTLLLRENVRKGEINLREFYIRRSFRIFPLYFIVLLVYIVLVFLIDRNSDPGVEFFKNLTSFSTFTSNWNVKLVDGRVIFYFAWSLATEEQFYLIWPAIQKYAKAKSAFVTICIFSAVVAAIRLTLMDYVFLNEYPILKIIKGIPLSICFGVIVAHLLHNKRSYFALRRLIGFRFSSIIAFFFVVFALSLSTFYPVLVDFAMAILIATCVYREDHLLAPILRLKFISYIGAVSFSIYMLHMLVKNIVLKFLIHFGIADVKILLFPMTSLMTIAVSSMSYRYIELYFVGARKRFLARLTLG